MLRPKVSTEPVFRDAIAAVTATLLPVAVVRVPVLGPMLLPGTLLDTVSILSVPWFVAPPLLGVLLVSVLVLLLRLLSVLLMFVLILPLLVLSMLLVFVLVLSLLLSILLVSVLVLLLLLLSMLLMFVLVLPLLLLSMFLMFVLVLLLRLTVLLRVGLLVLVSLLFRVVLLFVLLLVLRVGRSSHSEKQTQNGCAGDSNYFHRYYLHYCWLRYACSNASFRSSR